MRKLEWGALVVLGGVIGAIGLSVPRGGSPAVARPAPSDITDEASTFAVEAREEQVAPQQQQASYAPGMKEAVDEAYAKGAREGFTKGQDAGYQDGRQKGYAEGREAGLAEGHEQGAVEGFAAGAAQGYTRGHRVGFAEGFQQGLDARRDGDGQ